MSKEEKMIKNYNSLSEIREEFVRDWCKKRNINYDDYNPIMHGQVRGEHKDIKYTKGLLWDNKDNETINKKLRRFRNIQISEEDLDMWREFFRDRQKEVFNGNLWWNFKDNPNQTNLDIKTVIKEHFKLLNPETEISDKKLNQFRERSIIDNRRDNVYNTLCRMVDKYDDAKSDNLYILDRIHSEGLDHCPYCLSSGEPNRKVNIERIEKYVKRNTKHYKRAKARKELFLEKNWR